MNSQEREHVTRFLTQLREARAVEKDSEAEGLIRETVTRNPDSAYLLVQRAMLLEQAVNAAKTRITELERQTRQGRSSETGGFLGRQNPWAVTSDEPRTAPRVPGAAGYAIPRNTAAPMASGGNGPSFLGTVASTAAGVVAGSFLFQGIENLMGHHGSGSSWSDPNGDHLAGDTTINNYYGTEPGDTEAGSPDSAGMLADDSDLPDDYTDTDTDFGDDSSWV